jgi:hypothetical protein
MLGLALAFIMMQQYAPQNPVQRDMELMNYMERQADWIKDCHDVSVVQYVTANCHERAQKLLVEDKDWEK